jgi:hypothetical protein
MRGFWDVLVGGRLTDPHRGTSIYARCLDIAEHLHGTSWCYPTVGAGGAGWVVGASPASAAAAGTFGNYVDLIPSIGTTLPFDIHFLNIEALGSNGVYEAVIGVGAPAAEVEVARVRFARLNNQESANGVPVTMAIQPAGTRVRIKLACSVAGPVTVTVSTFGHYYD